MPNRGIIGRDAVPLGASSSSSSSSAAASASAAAAAAAAAAATVDTASTTALDAQSTAHKRGTSLGRASGALLLQQISIADQAVPGNEVDGGDASPRTQGSLGRLHRRISGSSSNSAAALGGGSPRSSIGRAATEAIARRSLASVVEAFSAAPRQRSESASSMLGEDEGGTGGGLGLGAAASAPSPEDSASAPLRASSQLEAEAAAITAAAAAAAALAAASSPAADAWGFAGAYHSRSPIGLQLGLKLDVGSKGSDASPDAEAGGVSPARPSEPPSPLLSSFPHSPRGLSVGSLRAALAALAGHTGDISRNLAARFSLRGLAQRRSAFAAGGGGVAYSYRAHLFGGGCVVGALLASLVVGLIASHEVASVVVQRVVENDVVVIPFWPPTPPEVAPSAWSYSPLADDGPQAWAQISDPATGLPYYPLCAQVGTQSPIDLPLLDPAAPQPPLRPMPYSYPADAYSIQSRPLGHPGFQVLPCGNYTSGVSGGDDDDLGATSNCLPGFVTLGGVNTSLLQFHFHRPSEHSINGSLFALELHLVHVDASGIIANVVSVLFPGADNHNALLDSFWLELNHQKRVGKVQIEALLADTQPFYYNYAGSLTSPPCTPGVSWTIRVARTGVNVLQLLVFEYALGGLQNKRPLQPLGGRSVTAFSWR